MKKVILTFMALGLLLGTTSCRESTQEKSKEAMEAIGEDIEAGTEKAVQETGEAMEKAGEEIQEEMNGTDDMDATDDN